MQFQLVAGHAALDLANTLDNRGQPNEVELLDSYEALLRFAEQSKVITPAHKRQLARAVPGHALDHAIQLREAVHAIFLPLALEGTPPPDAIDTLNRYTHQALQHRAIGRRSSHYTWRWDDPNHPESPIWPLALGAAELLTSPNVSLVRACECDTCRWLFLDQSKNHSRRWCDMKICGNRTKARRYYLRRAANTASPTSMNDIAT